MKKSFSAATTLIGVLLVWFATSAFAADSSEVTSIRSQIQENNNRSRQILAEVGQLQAMKRKARGEISRGEICSGCNQTRSEIEAKGERFPHPGQHILTQSAAEIAAKQAAKDREFDEKIAELYKELRELEARTRSLYADADRLIYESRVAEAKAQQAKRDAELLRQQQAQQRMLAEAGQNLSDALKKSMQEAQAKLEKQRAAQLEETRQQLAALSGRRGQFYVLPPEDRQLATDLRALTGQIQESRVLSPQAKAEQDRLQELANSGLVSGPPAAEANGVIVVADNVASVWNRLMDVKESAGAVGKAFERLVSNGLLGSGERAKLVLENAEATTTLGNQVLGQLSPAADALLAGNYEQAGKVGDSIDAATGKFAAGVDTRARRASPTYDVGRSVQGLGTSVEKVTQPLTAPASNAERLQNYLKAASSAWDLAMAAAKPDEAKETKEAEPLPANAVRWGPATGAGPLGEQIAKTFRSASYSEYAVPQPITLYRAYGGEAGKFGSYWTRTPPAGPLQSQIDSALLPVWGNDANKVVQIRVPAGTKLFEGIAAAQGKFGGGGNQIFIQQIDPAWEIKK
jgi:hypothetical protein